MATAQSIGGEPAFIFVVTPAPPLNQWIADVHALLGEVGAPPQLTRYHRPAVTVGASGVVISEKKLGRILTIPRLVIQGVQAGSISLKPQGHLGSTTYQTVWMAIGHRGQSLSVALTPVVGSYGTVSTIYAQSLANSIAETIRPNA
ncbi:MAG: hypothetical protein EPN91_12085 [Salinibacterium sp.]|nr:MAG: hypothetical protein EPN91_12085 [Salinibacterium sp.]